MSTSSILTTSVSRPYPTLLCSTGVHQLHSIMTSITSNSTLTSPHVNIYITVSEQPASSVSRFYSMLCAAMVSTSSILTISVPRPYPTLLCSTDVHQFHSVVTSIISNSSLTSTRQHLYHCERLASSVSRLYPTSLSSSLYNKHHFQQQPHLCTCQHVCHCL